MATRATSPDRRAEALAFIREARERNAEHREAVLRSAGTLRQVAEKLRGRRR